jgi:hypothetical protein
MLPLKYLSSDYTTASLYKTEESLTISLHRPLGDNLLDFLDQLECIVSPRLSI